MISSVIVRLLALAIFPTLVWSQDVIGPACLGEAALYDFGCPVPIPGNLALDPVCLCSTKAYIETVLGCIFEASMQPADREAAMATLSAQCVNATTQFDYDALAESSLLLPPLTTDTFEGKHDSGFLMPTDKVAQAIAIQNQGNIDQFKDARYLSGPLGFFAVVILLKTIFNFLSHALPRVYQSNNKVVRSLRKNLLLPALGSYHHSLPRFLGSFALNIPTRLETIIIICYFIIDCVILFVDQSVFNPDFGTVEVRSQFGDEMGNRAGMLMVSEMMLLMLFAGRNNVLMWITGWPQDTFIVFHKWLGRTFLFNLFTHAIAMTIQYTGKHPYSKAWAPGNGWWRWGIACSILIGIIVFQSTHYLRSKSYEIFLILHIVLTAALLPSMWYHMTHEEEGYAYLYAVMGIWGFDRVIRVLRVLWSGLSSTAEISLKPGNVIEFKINYSERWTPYPGSFAYFHILRPSHFWQSHPFSITASPNPEDKGKLVLMTRVKDGVTKSTRDFLLMQPNHTARVRVMVDGPYGVQHPVHHYETLVLMAGGIGITGVYSYASELRENPDRQQRIVLIWCVADKHPMRWFGEQIEYLAADPRIEVQIHVVNGSSAASLDSAPEDSEEAKEQEKVSSSESSTRHNWGRPELSAVVHQYMIEASGPLAFLSCGPGSMNDDVRAAVTANLDFSAARVDYFEESFSW